MDRAIRMLPFLLLTAWGLVGAYILLRDPSEIGPDEGMEYAKALLVSTNPAGVGLEWNDQPWFYSYIFAVVAHANLMGMRFVIFSLFLGTVGWLTAIIIRSHGTIAGFVTVASLLTWAGMTKLALSVMCDVPAVSLMTLAGLLILTYEKLDGRPWLYPAAGLLAGTAFAIKLTAVVMLPFVVALLASSPPGNQVTSNLQRVARRLLLFSVTASATFLLCLLPGGSLWRHLLDPHLKASLVEEARRFTPALSDFLPAAGTILFALGALFFVRGTVMKRLTIAAGLSLLFVIIVHSFHRPFWWFYGVHFAFPLSILAGIGVGACTPSDGRRLANPALRLLFGLMAACLFVTTNLPAGWNELTVWANAPRAKDNEMLAQISSLESHSGYAFSYNNMMVSRAGRLMAPGLTILSKKRYWMGESPEGMVFTTVTNSRPIFVLLEDEPNRRKNWRQWLANEYVRTCTRDREALYVRKDLNPVPEVITLDRIRALGL